MEHIGRHAEMDERLKAGWVMITTTEPRLSLEDRNFINFSLHLEKYTAMCDWTERLLGPISTTWDAYGYSTFLFQDSKAAMLFKLTWGGEG